MVVAVEKLITPDILKPARYPGNELLAVHKPWDTATIRWVLTYPEVYEVGASNLGHIILYNILNAQPRQLCDRAYLPGTGLAAKLRASNTPLFAVESKRWLTEFDILGFSLSYELGATNILEMLDLAGIPLTWRERQGSGETEEKLCMNSPQSPVPFPLIFAGGQTATSNPEPYADFFDFFALGDGEELLPEIGLVLEESKQAGLSREQTLLDLAQIPGVYVPQFYDTATDGSVHPNRPDVPKRILRRVATPIPTYSIGLVPYVETVHDRLTIEIRRGCTRGCRFCQPGMLTRPARDVEPDQVIEAIEQGMRATGYNASVLALGATSSGEIVDFELTQSMAVDSFRELLTPELPTDIPVYNVDQVDLKAPATNQVMEMTEYLITVAALSEATFAQWQNWIEIIKAKDELLWEKTTKSGKSQLVNLRSRLFELELVETNNSKVESISVLRYMGSCRHDGLLLRPEQILFMLETVADAKFQLLHIHRNQLVLGV